MVDRIKRQDVVINLVIEILGEVKHRLTLRQIFYRLVGQTLRYNIGKEIVEETYLNTLNNYKYLSTMLVKARKEGKIDSNKFVDRHRNMDLKHEWNPSNKQAWDHYMRSHQQWITYHSLNKWIHQDKYVIVVLEKDALSSIVSSVTNDWGVSLVVGRGYNSYTQLVNIVSDIKQRVTISRTLVFLTLGDFDPTGHDIMRNFQDNIIEMLPEYKIIFEEVALTKKQIEEYDLTPVPVKKKDSRSQAFIEKHGNTIVELDSIRPDTLPKIIEAAIKPHFDQELGDKLIEKNALQRNYLKRSFKYLEKLYETYKRDNPDPEDTKDYEELFDYDQDNTRYV